MRILFLTNFYPPHHLGGQGRSCERVVAGLRERGHQIRVVTSRHGIGKPVEETIDVSRCLYLEMELARKNRHPLIFFTRRKARERYNVAALQSHLRSFCPDVAFVWGMWNLPRSLARLAEQECSGRVLYRFAEYWPTLPSQHVLYWRQPSRGRLSRHPKLLLSRIAFWLLAREGPPVEPTFPHSYCVSSATRKKLLTDGIPIESSRVIHTGIDGTAFSVRERARRQSTLKLLFSGRLDPTKGIDTAIEAVGILTTERPSSELTLSVAGVGSAEYTAHLEDLVARNGLADKITFLGQVKNSKMPSLYRRHDVLLVPSTWPEPLARVILEGMASGLTVVATPVGGSSEVISDGVNGLFCGPEDPNDLAEKIDRLRADEDLRRELARAGRQTIQEQFTETGMLDKIESFLTEIRAKPVTR